MKKIKGFISQLLNIIVNFVAATESMSRTMLINSSIEEHKAIDRLITSENGEEIEQTLKENVENVRKGMRKTALMIIPFIFVLIIVIIVF